MEQMQKLVIVFATVVVFTVFAVGQASANIISTDFVTREDGVHRLTLSGTSTSMKATTVSKIVGISADRLGKCGMFKVSLLEEGNWPLYVNLYRYSLQRGRCHKDGHLTAIYRLRRWSEFAASEYFWFWRGHIGFASNIGRFSAFAWTQGEYERCIISKGCFEQTTPWLELRFLGNGRVIRNKGAGS